MTPDPSDTPKAMPIGRRFVSGQQPAGQRFGADYNPRGRPWTPGDISALGTASDQAVANAQGRSRMAVTLKRLELGIPAANNRGRPRKPTA